MAFALEQDARDAYAGQNANAARLRAVMGAAAGTVSRIAPAPSPMDATYPGLAASAEILVGEYLWHTGGFVTRTTDIDQTTQYGTQEGVEASVRGIMGSYAAQATATTSGGSYSLDVASTFPAT